MLRGLIFHHIEAFKRKDRRLLVLYLAGFILSISTNVTAYINSSFIENFVKLEYVSLFFIASNAVTFFAMLYFPKIIKKIGNFDTAKIVILVNLFSTGLLAILGSPYWIFFFFILMWVSANLLWINMDMFVESFTSNENTGRVRAIFFTTMNLGWIASPNISTNLVRDNNYSLVYLASVLFLIAFYLLIKKYKKILSRDDIIYQKLKVKEVVKIFWQDLNLRGIYISSVLLSMFFSLVVIYMPIYLHDQIGFSWPIIGVMFSIMLIPFILVEIPAGYLADKYWGEIEMKNIGFSILIISLLIFFVMDSKNMITWTLVLFFSRIGAALIEAMRESSFFKIVNVENVGQINFLRTSYPLGFFIATIFSTIILSFYSVQFVFLFLAIFLLSSFYFVNIIKDSK